MIIQAFPDDSLLDDPIFGANGLFTEEQKRRLTHSAIAHVNGRAPVIVGTSAMSTVEVVRMSSFAQEEGATAVLVVPMNYWPLTQSEAYQHYRAVAESIEIPLVVYNNPWTTGVELTPTLIWRLADLPNVRYVKESTGDLSRISEIRCLTQGNVALFAGWESTSLEALAAGARGWLSGMTNIVPARCVELFDAAVNRNDWLRARECFERIFLLCLFMCEKSPVRVAHAALELLGRPMGPPRRPFVEGSKGRARESRKRPRRSKRGNANELLETLLTK